MKIDTARFCLAICLGMIAACSPPNRTFNEEAFPPIQSMKCTLNPVHTGVLNPDYYRERSSGTLTLIVRRLDAPSRTAEIEGNSGVEAVEFRRSSSQMQFIETTLVGNLNVTVVFAPPSRGQPMPAVHSRHVAVGPANVSISQYAGECVAI
ncbi:hypothetical protein [Brevundimonas sp.]|uniref:hypothetical protein n=1 Tax=Brevundimonas sp. TaxID=1871086 RepID=UPI003AF7E3C4